MQKVACILGITCTGKDTLVERMVALYPNIGAIQVGKEFRKRYSPEKFAGLGAMASTEKESWEIFDEQWALCQDKDLILVTAQPRMPSQVREIVKRCHPSFYILTCSDEELDRRMQSRFTDQDGWMELAKKRVTNDKIQMCDTMIEIINVGLVLDGVFDTTDNLDEVAGIIYELELA